MPKDVTAWKCLPESHRSSKAARVRYTKLGPPKACQVTLLEQGTESQKRCESQTRSPRDLTRRSTPGPS